LHYFYIFVCLQHELWSFSIWLALWCNIDVSIISTSSLQCKFQFL